MMLWREYKIGVEGNKPASEFTMDERNANGSIKQQYHNRSKVRRVIKKLIDKGYSAEVAVHKIYQAYGYNNSITHIIKRIVKDNKNGG